MAVFTSPVLEMDFLVVKPFANSTISSTLPVWKCPNSLLCINSDNGEVILFVPDRDLRFQNPSRQNDFPGRPLGEDPQLSIRSGITNIRSFDRFESQFTKWINNG